MRMIVETRGCGNKRYFGTLYFPFWKNSEKSEFGIMVGRNRQTALNAGNKGENHDPGRSSMGDNCW